MLIDGDHHLPAEILESTRAVVWRCEMRNGRPTKVPYNPHAPSHRAAVDDPRTWGTFAEARAVVQAGRADGPGIVLGDGLVGVDLDHVRDPATGAATAQASAIIAALDSYAEVSPSGDGVHILTHGTLPPGRRRRNAVEMYDTGRFFTITGRHITGTPAAIHERTSALAHLHRQLFPSVPPPPPARCAPLRFHDSDAALIRRAHDARNGAKFAALWRGDTAGYPSASEADLALVNLLAFWARGDAARIDDLFRQSGLYRPKWDTRRGNGTYGTVTIATALGSHRVGDHLRRDCVPTSPPRRHAAEEASR